MGTYWPTPHHTIPIGPTTVMARTSLWSAVGGMSCLVQGEEHLALRVTFMTAGELLPQVVHHYREHAHPLAQQADCDELGDAARVFAWRSGNGLASVLGHRPHSSPRPA